MRRVALALALACELVAVHGGLAAPPGLAAPADLAAPAGLAAPAEGDPSAAHMAPRTAELDHPRLRLAIDELLCGRPGAAAPHLAAYLAAAPADDPGRRPALLLSAIAHRELREYAAFHDEIAALEQTADRWGACARLLALVDRLDRGAADPSGNPLVGPEYVTPAAAVDAARLGDLYRLAAATLLAARGETESAMSLLATTADDPELGAGARALAAALAAGPGLAPGEAALADSLVGAEAALRSGAAPAAARSFAAAAAGAGRAAAALDPAARSTVLAALAPEDLAPRLSPLADRSPDAFRIAIDDRVLTARLIAAAVAEIGIPDRDARSRALAGAADSAAALLAPAPLTRAETAAIARDLAALDEALGRLARARRLASERAAMAAALAAEQARLDSLRAAEARLLAATEIELAASAERVETARGRLPAAVVAATARAMAHLDSLAGRARDLAAAARGLPVLFPPAEPGASPEPAFLAVHRRTATRDQANLAAFDSAFAVARDALPPLVAARVRGERWPALEGQLARAEALAARVTVAAGPFSGDPTLMAAARSAITRLLPLDPTDEAERWRAIAERAADRLRVTVAAADEAAVGRARERLLVLAEAARFGRAEALYQAARRKGGDDAPDAGAVALRAAAAAYEDFVAAEPAGPGVAAAWLRVGELRYQLAEVDFREAMARYEEDRRRGIDRVELPVRDTAGASAAARAFLERFPSHPRADRALYNLGVLSRDGGDLAASTGHFERLRREHPASPLAAESAFRIGDNHFALGAFPPAAAAYAAIAGDPGPLGAAALYKLAWCRLNDGDPAAAAAAFADLLARDVDAEIHADAAGTLARCLADLGGAPAAERLCAARPGPACDPTVFHLLAQELADRADYPAAVAAARAGAARHPDAPELADLLADEIAVLDRAARPGEAARARLDFARRIGPGTPWFAHHGSDSLAVRAAEAMLAGADQLMVLARRDDRATPAPAHASAPAPAAAALAAAHAAYREFLARFPTAAAADRAELMAAECEMTLGDPRAAAASYGRALAATTDSTRARAAAYGAVVAWAEARGAAPDRAADLAAEMAAIDTFVGRFGTDERVTQVLMRRGAIAGRAGLCAESIASYTTLLAHAPARDDRRRALRAQGDAALRCEQPAAAAAIYAELTAECEGRSSAMADLCTEARALLPVARFRAAEALAATGDSLAAGRAYADLARSFPDFPEADLALLRAGDAARAGGDRVAATAHYRELAARHPDSANRPAALLRQADLAAAAGDTAVAASEYLRFAAAYPVAHEAAAALAAARHLARTARDWTLLEAAARAEISWRKAEPAAARLAAELDLAWALRASGRASAARTELDRMLSTPGEPSSLRARAHLLRADLALPDYERVALAPPLATAIERKKAALAALLADLDPAARSGDPADALAARELLGSALAEFGRALESSELPPDLEGADLIAYSQDVAAQADAFYRRAEAAWRRALNEAARAGIEHPAAARARAELFRRYDLRYAEVASPAFGELPLAAGDAGRLARSAAPLPTPAD